MQIRCFSSDGVVLFDLDFLQPPAVGDLLEESHGRIVSEWRVVERRFVFREDGDVPALFLILTPGR
jgi:hypothetical protein